jgi:hypothetical protein
VTARFVDFAAVQQRLRGKAVAIVGSAPSCLDNKPGFVDGHDEVVRVNNFKLGTAQGRRTTIHHAFYGSSIRSKREELKASGVTLCMCKCPNSKPLSSEWHERNNRPNGVDYRYIYRNRANWWFCDTFVPTDEHFLRGFNLLGQHQPTSGFAAILDVLACEPRSVYLTGFDFFTSKLHNVNERWEGKNPDDPIRHMPEREAAWVFSNAHLHPLLFDRRLIALKKEFQ